MMHSFFQGLSLRAKTIIGIALIEFVLLTVLIMSVLGYLYDSNEIQIQRHARVTASTYTSMLSDPLISGDLGVISSVTQQLASNDGITFARVLDPNGRTLAEFGDPHALSIPFAPSQKLSTLSENNFLETAPVTVAGTNYGSVQLGFDVSYLNRIFSDARHWSVGIALLEMLLVALFSYLLSRYINNHFTQFSLAAERISKGEGFEPMSVSGDDEIARASVAFNRMAENINQARQTLESEVAQRTQEIKEDREEQTLVRCILQEVTQGKPLLETLERCLKLLMGATWFELEDKGGIFLYEDGELVLRVNHQLAPQLGNLCSRVALGQCHCGRAASTRRLQFSNCVDSRHEITYPGMPDHGHYNIPLVGPNNRLLGVIVLYVRAHFVTSPKLESFLKTIGNILASYMIRSEAEVQLIHAKEAAEKANNIKSQFIASVSHDIRTPLNAMLGIAEILSRNNKNDDHLLLETMLASGRHLKALINDILDINKIESGDFEVIKRPFSLGQSIGRTLQIFTTSLEDKRLKLVINPLPEGIGTLVGDSVRLEQILVNLIGNAIKFTDIGQIHICVRILQKDEKRITLLFSIKDTGIGIPDEALESIFQPFTQAQNVNRFKHGGTGLGLAICKNLINMMGGEIGARKLSEGGTELWFSLPFEASHESLDEIESSKPFNLEASISGMRVLLVDDSMLNLDVTQRILEAHGCYSVIATSGEASLNILQTDKTHFDAVLMDIQMPDMDGFETTRRIRKLPKVSDIPVIALSAATMATQINESIEAGFNDFLTKPVDAEHLCATLARHYRIQKVDTRITPAPRANLQADKFPEIPGIDTEQANLQLMGDQKLFLRLLINLREEFWSSAEHIEDLLQENNLKEARAIAHKLRGMAGNLWATKIHAIATLVEQKIADNDLIHIASTLHELSNALNEVIAGMPDDLLPNGPSATPPEPQREVRNDDLISLREELERSNLSAIERFEILKPHLEKLYGSTRIAPIAHAIDALDFKQAASLLSELTA